jgi:zinc transport system substrate-binding protein
METVRATTIMGETVDSHVWMDPLRVADATESVVTALVDVDPANGDVSGANATPVEEELADRHEDVEATVAAGSTSTILVAGHDSFRSLGHCYGLEIESLTNVSPDDRPTTQDIERATPSVNESVGTGLIDSASRGI